MGFSFSSMNSFPAAASSLASASSSTLIVTPGPTISKLENIHHTALKKTLLVRPAARHVLHGRMSGKGFIEPHHSHLPRRSKRKVTPIQAIPCTSIDTNKSEKGQSSVSVQPTPPRSDNASSGPSLLAVVDPLDVDQLVIPTAIVNISGPLQPHVSHLPRRHTRAPARLGIAGHSRSRKRCLQELGRGSGVYVGFVTRDNNNDGDDGGVGSKHHEEDCSDLKPQFMGIVRLTTGRSNVTTANEEALDPAIPLLHLSIPPPRTSEAEAGCSQLTEDQLRSGCAFLHRQRRKRRTEMLDHQDGEGSVIVLAPPTHAVDALSLAAYYLVSVASEQQDTSPSESICGPSITSEDADEDYNSVHRLVMRLHDLHFEGGVGDGDDDVYVSDVTTGARTSTGPGLSSGSGLQEAWRGLLSWEGMRRLGGVWLP